MRQLLSNILHLTPAILVGSITVLIIASLESTILTDAILCLVLVPVLTAPCILWAIKKTNGLGTRDTPNTKTATPQV